MRACEHSVRLLSGIGVRRCRGHPACWMHAWARGVSTHRRGPRSYRPRRLVWHNAGKSPLGSARLGSAHSSGCGRIGPAFNRAGVPAGVVRIDPLCAVEPRSAQVLLPCDSRNNQSISLFALTPSRAEPAARPLLSQREIGPAVRFAWLGKMLLTLVAEVRREYYEYLSVPVIEVPASRLSCRPAGVRSGRSQLLPAASRSSPPAHVARACGTHGGAAARRPRTVALVKHSSFGCCGRTGRRAAPPAPPR